MAHNSSPSVRLFSRLLPPIALALLVGLSTTTQSQTVRGQVVLPWGAPAMGIPVNVNHVNKGRSGTSYTGPDGMYYLYGIPPGRYTLEIWPWPNRPPITRTIQVFERPLTDIPPFRLQ